MPISAQSARLKARLQAIPKAVREATTASLLKSANEVADAMRAAAPKDTGALASSITVTPGGSKTPAYSQPGGSHTVKDNVVAITAGNSEVRYVSHVEYGTTHASPEPFFWSTYRAMKDRIRNRTKRAIRDAVKKAAP